MDGSTGFTLVLDDPAGNSYIECTSGADVAAGKDPLLKLERYERTPEQVTPLTCGLAHMQESPSDIGVVLLILKQKLMQMRQQPAECRGLSICG